MAEIIFPNGSKLSDLLPFAGGTLTSTLITRAIYPATDSLYTLGQASHYWAELFTVSINIDDANTYVMNNAGNMKFVVATGKKFEFVVG